MRRLNSLAPLACCFIAGACASLEAPMDYAETRAEAAMRAAKGPHLDPLPPPPAPPPRLAAATGANSLWQAGARTFFADQRARQVGDILTVRIDIDDSAELSNSSSRSRSGSTSAGVNALLGAESSLGRAFGGGFDPANLIDAEGSASSSGQGAVNRTERVALTVAASIIDVLPNGNFMVEGRQQVRINAELRELTVGGLIRPEDIASDNTIRHTQIAEARISYGGRGQVSAVQRPGYGQRIADAIAPW